jgi:predicted transcriptional regulator
MRQRDLAQALGISPAYLNLLEKGRRPVRLPLLVRAAEALRVDAEALLDPRATRRPERALAALLDDPLARTLELGDDAIAALSTDPRAASTIAALFHLYKNTRAELDRANRRAVADPIPTAPAGYAPGDEVTDFLQHHGNYFAELEAEAAELRRAVELPRRFGSGLLIAALRDRFGFDVELTEPSRGSSVVRELDPGARRLRLSAALSEHALKFQLGHVLGLVLLDRGQLHERLLRDHPPIHPETPRLVKIHLANYFAGALMLPYDGFHEEVVRTRYDVERIAAAFESSYEAVAHRMCNLGDPARPGIPFHFLRVDVAGNISKRYSASGLRFPQGHGSCPKWAVHAAFLTPAVVTRQYSRMPDGTIFFCFAKVQAEPSHGSLVRGTIYSIGLGCRAEHAPKIVYSDDLPRFGDGVRATVPTGVTCRFCERTDCNQRAAPSYRFAFAVDEYVKKDNFFSPLTGADKEPK